MPAMVASLPLCDNDEPLVGRVIAPKLIRKWARISRILADIPGFNSIA
jgi:hypothetical protein